MQSKEIAPGIVVYSNVIQNSERLILDIEEGMQSAGISWGQAYVRSGDEIKLEESSRNTQIIAIPYNEIISDDFSSPISSFNTSLSNLFLESFSPIEKDYKSLYAADTRTHESYSILKYGVGQNFVNHIDDHFEGPRRISHVHYLNDNYEGGELYFPNHDIKIKPLAGSIAMYPSGHPYTHESLNITKGRKMLITHHLRNNEAR